MPFYRIGRYYTFFIAVTVDLIAGFVMSFANSFWMFCLFRFIVGVANISLYIMAFVIGKITYDSAEKLSTDVDYIPSLK